jgi:hypothetical protein
MKVYRHHNSGADTSFKIIEGISPRLVSHIMNDIVCRCLSGHCLAESAKSPG